jgi:Niemann-Pick C2 protein
MKSTIAVAALLSILTVVRGTTVSQCGDIPLPDDVQIENCDQPPCVFYINTTSSMTMTFKTPRKLEHIAPSAVAHVMSIDVSYPLDQDDACDGIVNTECPLDDNQVVEYTYSMFILPIFPEVTLTLEFSLVDQDQDNEPFECFQVELALKSQP